jgi:hypothetical protein
LKPLKRQWLVLASFVVCGSALAEPNDKVAKPGAATVPAKTTSPAAKKAAPAAKPAAASPGDATDALPPAAIPDQYKLNMLIRSMVIAVNQANKTGNYTVLRDLGSPRFRKSNTAEQLAAIFEAQRKSKFDLSPILFFTPKLLRPAALTEDGMLRLTGFFDTRPQRVAFDFLFEDVKGEWQLYGINIATTVAPPTAAPSAP